MPPELKKPITCMEQMTCENCVFSATRKEFGDPKSDRSYTACHNSENEYFLDEITGQGNFCSQGQWLWNGKLSQLGVFSHTRPVPYISLYEMFASRAYDDDEQYT